MNRSLIASASIAIALVAGYAKAVPPSESVLPASTVAYVTIPDSVAFNDAWNRTQFSRMLADPVMKEFSEDLRRQLQEKWTQSHARLGLSLEDFQGIASGELSLAVLRLGREFAFAVLADVTQNTERAEEAIKKATAELIKQGASKRHETVGETRMTILEIPPRKKGQPTRHAVYFMHGGFLGAFDDLKAASTVLKAIQAGGADEPLGKREAFLAVFARCTADAGGLVPHLRWFIEPIALAEAVRSLQDPRQRRETDYLKVAINQGFEGIQGVGGFVNFSVGSYGFLHRTFIYAPPPYKLAMRMLVFPNTDTLQPQPWVSREVATYSTIQCDLLNAFERFDTLFDEIYGEEGVWEDTIEGLKNDPNGPFDIREELVNNLGQRVSILTDYKLPITPTSQRLLVAIEAKNPDSLAQAVAKSMKGDPRARKLLIGENVAWEIIADENVDGVPDLQVQNPGGARDGAELDKLDIGIEGRLPPGDNATPEEKVVIPNSAVTVAHGHLLIASHLDLLEKVLAQVDPREHLSRDVDYQLVNQEITKLGAAAVCTRGFSRIDEQARPTYELFRQGKLPEADTLLARVLNIALGSDKEGVLRKPSLDGSKLPEYEAIRRYFGPAGRFTTSEEQGWFIVGFSLSREGPLATGANHDDSRTQ